MRSATFVYLCLAVGSAHAGSTQPEGLGAWAKVQSLSWRVSTPRGFDSVGDGENDVIRTQSVILSDHGAKLIYRYQEVTLDTSGNYSPVEHHYQFTVPLEQVTIAGSEPNRDVSPTSVVHGVRLSCLNGERCISEDCGSRQNALWLGFVSSQEAIAAAAELKERMDTIIAAQLKPAAYHRNPVFANVSNPGDLALSARMPDERAAYAAMSFRP